MSVDSKHKDYQKFEDRKIFQSCRDVVDGDHAVKDINVREDYVPKPSGQNDSDYEAYLKRGSLFGATARTLQAYKGLIFRKPATVMGADQLEDFFSDVDSQGTSMQEFAKRMIEEKIQMNRYGVLLDGPKEGGDPFFRFFEVEDIIYWSKARVFDKIQYNHIRVKHQSSEINEDFEEEVTDWIIVLKLTEEDGYTQEWYKKDDEQGYIKDDTIQPSVNEEKLDYIPFVMDAELEGSVLLPLIDEVLQHYRHTVDLGHVMHWCALPILWGAGMKEQGTRSVGGPNMWAFANPQAKVQFAQVDGSNLPHFDWLEKSELRMAVLGARVLANRRQGVEAAETARMRQSGEGSILSDIASGVSKHIMQLLTWLADWLKIDASELSYELNQDYIDTKLSPQELTALVGAWQSGLIPIPDVYDSLHRGEYLNRETTLEDFQASVDVFLSSSSPEPQVDAE